MGVHRALGLASGARGVDQDRQVFGLAGLDALHQCIGVQRVEFAAQFAQLRQAENTGVVQLVQAFHVEHDDLAQHRQLLAHLERLVELLVVFDEQHRGARVLAQVVHLAGRIGGVDAIGDTAAAEHRQVGQHPLDHGVGQDRGRLLRLEAQAHEAAGDLAHGLGGLLPGPAAPDAELFLAHPHVGSALLDGVPEHRRDGVARHHEVGAGLNL
jgi:hypothetical protein